MLPESAATAAANEGACAWETTTLTAAVVSHGMTTTMSPERGGYSFLARTTRVLPAVTVLWSRG